MFKFRKSIFTAASPNTQFDDAFLAFRILLQPWSWRNKKYDTEFIDNLKSITGISYFTLIDSGRSALMAALHAIDIKQNDEVIMPSFTCVVVADAVKWAGANAIYLETNKDDFNGEYENIEKYVSQNTKAVIAQHTFGKFVDIDKLRIKLNNLGRSDIKIIEDFAHVIHENIQLKGDIGFMTFGIEKVISSVRGGAVVTNSSDLSEKVESFVTNLPEFPLVQVWKSILNPIFWTFAIPLHSVGVGRFTIGAFIRGIWRKLGFLGIMVEDSENKAIKPNWFPCKMSPALSKLGNKQLNKLESFNIHRNKISKIYFEHLGSISDDKTFDDSRIYLRFPILLNDKKAYNSVWDKARSLRVTLGNWFSKPLYGATVNDETYRKLNYNPASTPETLLKTELVLNLPTSVNISEKRATELAKEIRKIL